MHVGRQCTVFAELDMIHKQQMGYQIGAIGTAFLVREEMSGDDKVIGWWDGRCDPGERIVSD